MECSYRHPSGVENPPGTDLLVTPHGGAVVIDEPLHRLWNAADGQTLAALRGVAASAGVEDILPEALACLAEAGLLQRQPPADPAVTAIGSASAASVTAIVVVSSAAELDWLRVCLESLNHQDARPTEIILVDNGGVTSGTFTPGPVPCRVVRRRRRGTYAAALNDGVRAAQAAYFLLLNADVKLHTGALAAMLEKVVEDPRIAAVAPKLKFWRTAGFLNGIGNRVREADWGTDNAIGQLDLGQFDHWTDVPSGCFAALLISRRAFEDVGEFDAGYPAYYEDADWSYRARALGYRIAAAPAAEVLHVFSASWSEPSEEGLSPGKQSRAAAGRLRFAWKIPTRRMLLRLVPRLVTQDVKNAFVLARHGSRRMAWAHLRGVLMFVAGLPGATWRRLSIQRRRRVADEQLFVPEASMPMSALDGSRPRLTSGLIRDYYAPLIRAGRTRPLPELA